MSALRHKRTFTNWAPVRLTDRLYFSNSAKWFAVNWPHLLPAATTLVVHLFCGRGLQPEGRATGMGDVEISEDGARYPLVNFHCLAQRYGVAHQRLQSR